MNAALARRRSRVQIPPGPPTFELFFGKEACFRLCFLMSDLSVFACGVYPDPCLQELIDASVALSLREFLKSAANRLLNDYNRISRFGHLYSPSRRGAYISALYLKSSEKNHKLEIDPQKIRAFENASKKFFINVCQKL